MIYSQQLQLLFTHVSRTGGTPITDCIFGLDRDVMPILGQHDALAAARPILGDEFDTAFKFAFVRNPWDRFVSWYALIGQVTRQLATDCEDLANPKSEHWKQFDDFLESWSCQEIEIDGIRRRRLSQWAQLTDAKERLLVDDFGRFETLDEGRNSPVFQSGD